MSSRAQTEKWQRRLLPLMIGMIVVLTGFFLVSTLIQLYRLQAQVENSPDVDLGPAFSMLELKGDAASSRLDYARWKTLAILEANALEQRHHQASVLVRSRNWVKYLGFVTGIMLTSIGAVFVLGKLSEQRSELDAKSEGGALSIKTTSPGLVLAVLGTVLMLGVIFNNPKMEVTDAPTYVSGDLNSLGDMGRTRAATVVGPAWAYANPNQDKVEFYNDKPRSRP